MDGVNMEQITQFKYLDCIIIQKWEPDQEIRCKVEQSRTFFLHFYLIKTWIYSIDIGS